MAAGTTLLVWLLQLTALFKALEAHTLDWRFLFRGPHGPRAAQIVLVLVEEEAALDYRSPIPRRYLAQVIDRLGPARLIGLDILLDKPSFDKEGDELLRQALAQNGKVVAVSYIEDGEEHLPHPYFREALVDVGYATFTVGTGEEVVRNGTLVRDLETSRVLSFAAALYTHCAGLDPAGLRSGAVAQLPGGIEVGHSLLIDYSGPPNAVYRHSRGDLPGGFMVCPSHLVAAGVYPPGIFQDKIVLIGTGLSDAPDRFRTPFFAAAYGYEKMLGVEIHAHFLRTLLSGVYLHSWSTGWTMALVLFLALVVGGCVVYTDVLRSSSVLALLLAGLWGAGFIFFAQQGVVIPLIAPSLGLLGAYGLTVSYHALTEGREKKQIRRLFEKYLSPEIIAELIQDPAHWKLGGKSMEITVMFADLEGFTPLAEKLKPEELVKLINQYLTEMSRIIWVQGGTIDKYEGDLIMAFFGAPLPQVDHAARACRAALQMQARLAQLRDQWRQQNFPELRVRIGLHSGQAVVGNMGSDFRFNYTAMGDTVNLAARLEPANKEFGTYTLVSEATREQARAEGLSYRSLGAMQVKGKNEPVKVYELLPLTDY